MEGVVKAIAGALYPVMLLVGYLLGKRDRKFKVCQVDLHVNYPKKGDLPKSVTKTCYTADSVTVKGHRLIIHCTKEGDK